MEVEKIKIERLDDFRRLEGSQLFVSEPIRITKQRIQDFCRGTLNEEWIHWDSERARKSYLGDIIAPGLFLPALFPGMFWQHMAVELPRFIVKGIEGIRVFRPVLVNTRLFASVMLASVLERTEGVEVHYQVEFFEVGINEKIAQVTFINRYWDT
jgi:acyl dehydratase